MEFGAHDTVRLDGDLLRALTTGDMVRLEELLGKAGHGGGGDHPGDGNGNGSPPHRKIPQADGLGLELAINLADGDAAPVVVEAALAGYPRRCIAACLSSMARWSCILGVTSNGNTALHLVASRGHADLAEIICKQAPSLVAAPNESLDTPLHCAARAGHLEVVTRLLNVPTDESAAAELAAAAEAALRVRNCLGATVLHEAVRHGHTEVVTHLMTRDAQLASVTSDDGVSPLYLAATTGSVPMVQALLRPSGDGTRSPASFAGREGRTALHVAATKSAELAAEILTWEPSLLTRVDSAGRIPLHFAIQHGKLGVIRLFLKTEASVARVCDGEGLFPLHRAAIAGERVIIDEIVGKCTDFHELVDNRGRNFLHCAVEHGQDNVVRYICQDIRFAMLLNATDSDGNTPLHLAVKYAHPGLLSSLLQSATVKIDIINKDGLTAADLARRALPRGRSFYFLDPHALIWDCLHCVRAPDTIDGVPHLDAAGDESAEGEKAQNEQDDMRKTGTIASVLIATVAFAAAFTVPGGFVADDRPHAGTATLARRFAFRSFVVSDAMAFAFSIVATCFLVYAGAKDIPRSHRLWYSSIASGLVPLAAQFLIAAFGFGFHLVLGMANRGLMIFVYLLCSASVLLCFPGIWIPWHLGLGKAILRRVGWRGLASVHSRPSSFEQLCYSLSCSFLFANIRRPLFAVLITATFLVAIALDVALPNY
uniref:PGG domain-containing protein n=2 Tax=Oryza brachyantha TaxID=4533 RepID=J3MLK2_ORYBR